MEVFNEKKVTSFLHFILSEMGKKTMGYKKAIKLLYLCDRCMYAAHGKFITNDTYVSMSKGPVLVNTNSLIEMSKKDHEGFFSSHFLKSGKNITMRDVKAPSYKNLIPAEKRIAQYFVDIFGKSSEEEVIEFTHTFCDEWKNPDKEGLSIIPITIGDIDRALGKNE